jgi:hypothetical protein
MMVLLDSNDPRCFSVAMMCLPCNDTCRVYSHTINIPSREFEACGKGSRSFQTAQIKPPREFKARGEVDSRTM